MTLSFLSLSLKRQADYDRVKRVEKSKKTKLYNDTTDIFIWI